MNLYSKSDGDRESSMSLEKSGRDLSVCSGIWTAMTRSADISGAKWEKGTAPRRKGERTERERNKRRPGREKGNLIGIYATKGGGNRVGEKQRGNGRRTEEREEHIEKHPWRIRRKREWDIS